MGSSGDLDVLEKTKSFANTGIETVGLAACSLVATQTTLQTTRPNRIQIQRTFNVRVCQYHVVALCPTTRV